VQGSSMLNAIEKRAENPRLLFSELKLAGKNRKSAVFGCFKLIAEKSLSEPHPDLEFYDVCADPLERSDASQKYPVMSGYLKSEIIRWTASKKKIRATLPNPREAVLDSDSEERLRALGYVQ